MVHQNTTRRQDDLIKRAEDGSVIDDLIEIIDDLDQQITEWRKAADTGNISDPDELRKHFQSLKP